ncbi:MAG: hypothetical protein DSZ23_04790 [Thermodesulfatator sp.]|nr:MAG: hypothetical protein DSZ23_04790 [Thermodesulfatator sp.]
MSYWQSRGIISFSPVNVDGDGTGNYPLNKGAFSVQPIHFYKPGMFFICESFLFADPRGKGRDV